MPCTYYDDVPTPRRESRTMSIDDARRAALERRAGELGCPGNLKLAEWALETEAMIRDLVAILDERSDAFATRLDAAMEMARAAREWARNGG